MNIISNHRVWFYVRRIIEFSVVLVIVLYVIREMSMNTEDFYKLELENVTKNDLIQKNVVVLLNLPPFSLGTDYLNIPFTQDENELHAEIKNLVEKQLNNPETLMRVKDDPKLLDTIKLTKDGFLEFPSILDNTKR